VLSCVSSATVALKHGVRGYGGLQATVLVVREGVGDTAADLSWLSEYPEEGERAFPPLTSLVVHRSTVEGGCLLLEVQPSVPHMAGQLLEAERRFVDNKENASRGLVRAAVASSCGLAASAATADHASCQLADVAGSSAQNSLRLGHAVRSRTSARMCSSPRRHAPPRPKPRRRGGGSSRGQRICRLSRVCTVPSAQRLASYSKTRRYCSSTQRIARFANARKIFMRSFAPLGSACSFPWLSTCCASRLLAHSCMPCSLTPCSRTLAPAAKFHTHLRLFCCSGSKWVVLLRRR